MDIERLRLSLKALANDTRLRMVNLLNQKELMVKDICSILGVSQPTASKNLERLLLLKIVTTRREGNFIFYKLNVSSEYGRIIQFLLSEFSDVEVFKDDKGKLVSPKEKETVVAGEKK